MKKLLVLLLAALLVFALAACGQKTEQPADTSNDAATDAVTEETDAAPAVLGGFTLAASPVITDDIQALLDQATQELVGAEYTPVAYLANQIVAGTNHCLLCQVAPVVPEPVATYALVYIYEDLEGNAEITDVFNSEVVAAGTGLAGGWNAPESPELTEEAQAAFDKATADLTDASYTPLAFVQYQVVAGMNYCLLCADNNADPESRTGYTFVYIYADLEGNADITDTQGFSAL